MQGKHVRLRSVEREDYPLLQAWQNDPEIAHWMDYRTPFSLRDIEDDQERARNEGRPFVIEYDGRAIGKCGLNQFRWESRICALYIYVGDQTLHGKGLGHDSVMALLKVAFDELALERVELTMLADNEKAKRVYERSGFVLEGVLKGRSYRGGHWHDTSVMSVSRQEFERRRNGYGL